MLFEPEVEEVELAEFEEVPEGSDGFGGDERGESEGGDQPGGERVGEDVSWSDCLKRFGEVYSR